MENYRKKALRLLQYSEDNPEEDRGETMLEAQQATVYMLLAIHDSLRNSLNEVAQKLEDLYQLTLDISR